MEIFGLVPIGATAEYPCHFGPPHLHVSGSFEEQGITQ